MLLVVDMQNTFVNSSYPNSYVKGSEKLVTGILNRIEEYKKNGEPIFYTTDVKLEKSKKKDNIHERPPNNQKNIENKQKETTFKEEFGYQLYGALKASLRPSQQIKKSYYAIPPENIFYLQEKFKENIKTIELVGIETHLCVLANAIVMQSAFPEAVVSINESLCTSKVVKRHQLAIEVMSLMGIEIIKA